MRRMVRAVVVLLVLAGTAACGDVERQSHASATTSPDEVTAFAARSTGAIAREARARMRALSAVHYEGFITLSHRRIPIAGSADVKGNCGARMGPRHAAMRVVEVKGKYYVWFDRKALTVFPMVFTGGYRPGEAQLRARANRWWLVPPENMASLDPMCALRSRDSPMSEAVAELRETLVKGEVSVLDGQPTVELRSYARFRHFWIAASGVHRLVRVTEDIEGDGIADAEFAFSDFDRPVIEKVPPHGVLRSTPGTAT